MTLYSLDDLTRPLTVAESQAQLYEVLALVGVDTTNWKPGGVVRTMLAATARMHAAFSTLAARIVRSGFLELSDGSWLSLVARYVYGVEREAATFAAGEATLVNTGGGIFSLDAGDLVLLSDAGKQYRNAADVALGALATLTIPIVAVEAGSASSAAPGEISAFVTPLLGVTCSNAAAVVGRDDESDAALRARCASKLGSLSPMGPWDAYSYAARTATRSDGSLVGITRVRTRRDAGGRVTTYIATSTGPVTGTADDVTTDLGAVSEAVQHRAAPLAITADVESATAVEVSVSYRVWLANTSGKTQAQLEQTIALALATFLAAQPIGGNIVGAEGRIYRDAIRAAISLAVPQIYHAEVLEPAADVVLAISDVAVLGTVTADAITQTPPSEGAPS